MRNHFKAVKSKKVNNSISLFCNLKPTSLWLATYIHNMLNSVNINEAVTLLLSIHDHKHLHSPNMFVCQELQLWITARLTGNL